MAVAAGLMALRPDMTGREKWLWTMVLFAFAGIEIRAINHDRNESENKEKAFIGEQRQHFSDIGDGIKTAIRQGSDHFDTTMHSMAGIIETNTEILIKENKNLVQTMGGSGYPLFLPTFPSNNPSTNDLWPVKVFYPPRPSRESAPLVDVNVDISVEPSKSAKAGGVTPEVIETMFNPVHYNLGTIVRGVFNAPFQLQSGKRYQLVITTRRDSFVENINIDQSPSSPGGYRLSWCIYRHADNKLLDGKCE